MHALMLSKILTKEFVSNKISYYTQANKFVIMKQTCTKTYTKSDTSGCMFFYLPAGLLTRDQFGWGERILFLYWRPGCIEVFRLQDIEWMRLIWNLFVCVSNSDYRVQVAEYTFVQL